jgi:DNA repair exonuclease SbcCD nuclease subunit
VPRMVFFTDPHVSRTPPECRADTYAAEILEKFHEVARHAKKLKADAIVCGGDWFHRKGKVTFNEANDLLAVLRGWQERGMLVAGILGNHDISGHDLESLDGRAVGTLIHSKVLHLLDYMPLVLGEAGNRIYVTGTSYFHGCDANDDNRVRMYSGPPPESEDLHVHIAHGTLINKGEFFDEFTVAPALINLLHERGRLPDVIMCGHLHFSEGVKYYPRPDGRGQVAICRPGSLGRVASDDLERQPAALVLVNDGRKYVIKEVPVGKPPRRQTEQPGERPEDGHEQRIQEFVRGLREESESWSLVDHGKLIREITTRLGHDEEIAVMALRTVQKHQ